MTQRIGLGALLALLLFFGGITAVVAFARLAEFVAAPGERCTVQVLRSEMRIRAAVRVANAATENKVGVLIRELERRAPSERGLQTAWEVETME
jgi:hypothetical protein